jgi:hypothetical protein
MLDNYVRNRELIDFNYIPGRIEDKIMVEFLEHVPNNRMKIISYLQANNMNKLLQNVSDF